MSQLPGVGSGRLRQQQQLHLQPGSIVRSPNSGAPSGISSSSNTGQYQLNQIHNLQSTQIRPDVRMKRHPELQPYVPQTYRTRPQPCNTKTPASARHTSSKPINSIRHHDHPAEHKSKDNNEPKSRNPNESKSKDTNEPKSKDQVESKSKDTNGPKSREHHETMKPKEPNGPKIKEPDVSKSEDFDEPKPKDSDEAKFKDSNEAKSINNDEAALEEAIRREEEERESRQQLVEQILSKFKPDIDISRE